MTSAPEPGFGSVSPLFSVRPAIRSSSRSLNRRAKRSNDCFRCFGRVDRPTCSRAEIFRALICLLANMPGSFMTGSRVSAWTPRTSEPLAAPDQGRTDLPADRKSPSRSDSARAHQDRNHGSVPGDRSRGCTAPLGADRSMIVTRMFTGEGCRPHAGSGPPSAFGPHRPLRPSRRRKRPPFGGPCSLTLGESTYSIGASIAVHSDSA